MQSDDHWTEVLRCDRCRRTGVAEISAGHGAFEDCADLIPAGFKAIPLRYGAINFYCVGCDIPVKP
jgi:hypothetical protein